MYLQYVSVILAILLVLALGILQPLQERLGNLADLLSGRNVDLLLVSLGTPSLEGFLRHEVVLIVGGQDSGHLGDQSGAVLADERLLVVLSCDRILEEPGAVLDLLGDFVVEDALGQHGGGLVLGLYAKLLGLLAGVNVADLSHATLLHGSLRDLAVELLVSRGAIGLVVIVLQNQGALQVRGELLGAGLGGELLAVFMPTIRLYADSYVKNMEPA